MLFVQLERYKELKEIARKKVATLTQQLEKHRWEDKADHERLKLNQRKKQEVQVCVLSYRYVFRRKMFPSFINVCINVLNALM